MYRSDRFERQRLYEEVWSTPMWRLSKKYGLTDRGLSKICGRLGIPVPARGYWRRKETGKGGAPDPLPPLKEGQRDFVYCERNTPAYANDPTAQAKIESEKREENRICVASPGNELHPGAMMILNSLQKTKPGWNGILVNDGEGCSMIRVSKDTLERAILIFDALVRAFDTRGFQLTFEKEKQTDSVVIENVPVTFLLEEVLDRKERAVTPAEQKDKIKNPWKYSRPEYFYVPAGKLSLKITHPSWSVTRLSWTDGKRQRVEDCLNKFMAAMRIQAAEQSKIEKQREDDEKKRREEERRAEERRKLGLAEQRELWSLLKDSVCWQQSRLIRLYVEAVKRKMVEFGDTSPHIQELNDWVEWALQKADTLDPLVVGAYCTLEEKYIKSSAGSDNNLNLQPLEIFWNRMLRRAKYKEAMRERWGDGFHQT